MYSIFIIQLTDNFSILSQMKIIDYLKRHRKSTDVLLLIFFVGNIVLLGDVILSSFNNKFSIDVVEKQSSLPVVKDKGYTIANREVHSQITITSEKFLDFVFLNKKADLNLFFCLFTAFVLFQLMRIKSLWYHQYFTKKLYASIDALAYAATLMFLISRIQEYYLKNLVDEISKGRLVVDPSYDLLIIIVMIMILSNLLKSFAKQGNRIQEEQDLTI